MPNSRRRKFSVRNGISGKQSKPQNQQNELQIKDPEVEIQLLANNVAALKCSSKNMHYNYKMPDPDSEKKLANGTTSMIKCTKSKNKIPLSIFKNSNSADLVSSCDSSTSKITVKNSLDKDVTASSSNIDFFNLMYSSMEWSPWKAYDKIESPLAKETRERITRPMTRDRTPLKREKYFRQHRIKVRSPKRRLGLGILESLSKSNDVDKLTLSVGTEAIDWKRENDTCDDSSANVVETIDVEERQSNHSSDDMCRICHGDDTLSQELGQLISACACRGTVGRVHVKCLERWLTESGKSRCELCGTRYITRRIHRYGVPRALVMWILSQNAKQLMVDSLGIMLMSPLAVLAAWLSGRTLAGLMTQDAHATPWPLASTFVLACMTLVCYYCWIVSAATRHALGWWIWYRSQYEVRLQIVESEE